MPEIGVRACAMYEDQGMFILICVGHLPPCEARFVLTIIEISVNGANLQWDHAIALSYLFTL